MRIIEVIQIRKATPHFRTRYRCKKTRNNQTSQKLQENSTRRKKRTKYLPKAKKNNTLCQIIHYHLQNPHDF